MAVHPFSLLNADLLSIYVIYPATVTAKEVVMRLGVIVVMGLTTLYGYLLNEPVFFKEIQGVIDCGAGQGGVLPPEGLVDLLCRGMLGVAIEEVQDRGPLDSQEDSLVFEPCLLFREGHHAHAIFLTRKGKICQELI
jgi:hypothetical protein